MATGGKTKELLEMRKLLTVGGVLLAAALMLPVDAVLAQGGGINNTVVSGGGVVASGGGGSGGGGGGGQRPSYTVFGFPTVDAMNAALAANPGLVGVSPAPNSLTMPVQIAITSPKRP
jgi:hypothetical protein